MVVRLFTSPAAIKNLRVIQLGITILFIQYLSFSLSIDNSSTAIMSAIVVSQSFVGGLYLKVQNRIFGTLLGLAFALMLICLFPEAPGYYLTFTLLWFSATTILASLVHTDRTYLYQLAGYTFAFVGFGMLEDPANAYHTLLYRATNVILGLLIMLITATAIYPNYGAINVDYRVSSLYRGVLNLKKQLVSGKPAEPGVLKVFFDRLSIIVRNRLYIKSEAGLSIKQGEQLDRFLSNAMLMVFYSNAYNFSSIFRNELAASMKNEYQRLLNELKLYRFDGLDSGAPGSQPRAIRFHEHIFTRRAILRGLRTAIGTSCMLAIWYFTGWDGGSVMLTLGVCYIILCSTIPTPVPVSVEALNGTLQGIILGFIFEKFILPSVFLERYAWLYFVSQIPIIIYGGKMLTVPARIMRGITLLTTFYFVVPPENVTQYLDVRFINNSLGAFLGVLGAGITLCFIFPERPEVNVKSILRATLRDLERGVSKDPSSLLRKVMIFHDRIQKAGRSDFFSHGEAFYIMMDLGSLYIICYQVHKIPNAKPALMLLVPMLKEMQDSFSLDVSSNAILEFQYSLSKLRVTNQEAYQVALSIYAIIMSIHQRMRQ